MKVILLGPPGAGKGTQAKLIERSFVIPHISTGDIFRKHIKQKTELGMEAARHIDGGHLVPDELTLKIVKKRLLKNDCKDCFLLDGFPRTLYQAQKFDCLLEEMGTHIDMVFLLEASRDLIVDRIAGRLTCPKCGNIYHESLNKPRIHNICNHCGETLSKRMDDNREVAIERYSVYEKQTASLIDYYSSKGLLTKIDGTEAVMDIFERISSMLHNF